MNQCAPVARVRIEARLPAPLFAISLTELCERAAFYGMQAILFLYLRETFASAPDVDHIWGLAAVRRLLVERGASSPTQLASAFFGIATGLLYLSTIAGGWIADRLTGPRPAIVVGGLLSAAGYFLLAFQPGFLAGVALLIVGSGGFKGNIASEISLLYAHNDPRREDGFRFFFMAVQLGALSGPLISGSLGAGGNWRLGFVGCGLVALLSLGAYLFSLRLYARPAEPKPALAFAARGPAWSAPKAGALAVVFLALATVFTGAQQINNVYIGWVADLGLTVGGRPMPATWLLVLDTALQFAMLPLTAQMWRLWRRLGPEPGPIAKLSIGALAVGAAFVFLAAVPDHAGDRALPWLLMFHATNSAGYAMIMPVALALLTKAASSRTQSTVVALFYLQIAVGAFAAGVLGQWGEALGAPVLWLVHGGLFAGAALVLFAARRPLAVALGLKAAARPRSPRKAVGGALSKSWATVKHFECTTSMSHWR